MWLARERLTRSSGETAELLILVGIILQVLAWLGISFILLVIIPALGVLFFIIGLVILALVYIYCYARTRDGDYAGAEAPTLIFGILSLIFGGVIPGILYLIAWILIREEAGQASMSELSQLEGQSGWSSGSGSLKKACPSCHRNIEGDSPYCKWCGQPVAGVAPATGTAHSSAAPLPTSTPTSQPPSQGVQMQIMMLRRKVAMYNYSSDDRSSPSMVSEKESIVRDAQSLRSGLPPEQQQEIDSIVAGIR
jgi:hypothetical protein